MSELILPPAVLLASLSFTYFFCVRSMLRGKCDSPNTVELVELAELAELARLSKEVAALRA